MTTSLAILPPPPGHAQPSQPLPPLEEISPKRPKLSLNTTQVRTFGKGSTSLRLDTLSAVSPTVRNTFSNAYEPLSKPRLSINSAVPQAKSQESATTPTSNVNTPNSASTIGSNSTTSTSSSDSATIRVPYKVAHNLSSILSNSPIPQIRPRTMASSSRPMFPATKHVSFRAPLEEEITTSKYTMAHSDIASSASSSSTISSIETESTYEEKSETTSSSSSASAATVIDTTSSSSSSSPPASEQSSSPTLSNSSDDHTFRLPRTGEKRDSSSSDSDSDSCPETPVAGRRKRRREWVWTLGPIITNKANEFDSDEDSS